MLITVASKILFILITLSFLLPSTNANLLIAAATNDKLYLINSSAVTFEITTKVSHLEFLSQKYLASSYNNEITIWNLKTFKPVFVLRRHAYEVLAIKSLDEDNFISADGSALFFKWTEFSFSNVSNFSTNLNQEKLVFIKIHNNNKTAVGYTRLNTVFVFNIQTNEVILNRSFYPINTLEVLNETHIALASQNRIFFIKFSNTKLIPFIVLREPPSCLMFLSTLILGTINGTLYPKKNKRSLGTGLNAFFNAF
ncbi:unnamed protein product, partial [Brachionus calyciflorus]